MSFKLSNETKTGAFVLICVAALGALLIQVGTVNIFKKGYILKAQFYFTGGVKANAPVRLSGVDVGEVRAIRMLYGDDTKVEMDLWVEEGTKVHKDAHAYVTTLGMMGEKYIEIKPGTPGTPWAGVGDQIIGDDPVRLEELIEKGTQVADDVAQMSRDISKVANHVDDAIQGNRPKIDRIFDNLEETSENFNDFSQDVKHHPWKVLAKGKEKSREEMLRERNARRIALGKAPLAEVPAAPAVEPAAVPVKSNFSKK